jgi:GGDEF domain-containing protein
VCEKIKTFKITLGGEHLSLTLSAGIATAIKGHQVSAEGMVVLAEKALNNARKLGPGEVQLRKQESPQKTTELRDQPAQSVRSLHLTHL